MNSQRRATKVAAAGAFALAVIVMIAGATAGSAKEGTKQNAKKRPRRAAQEAVATVQAQSGTCATTFYCFVPESVTVQQGDDVLWTDASGSFHTVTRCTPDVCDGTDGGTGTDASFTTGDLADGQSFTHTFSESGTYNYWCTIHGFAEMHGVVDVQSQATTEPPTTEPPTTDPTDPTGSTNGPAATNPDGTPTPTNGDEGNGAGGATGDGTATGSGLANSGDHSGLMLAIGFGLFGIGVVLTATSRRITTR